MDRTGFVVVIRIQLFFVVSLQNSRHTPSHPTNVHICICVRSSCLDITYQRRAGGSQDVMDNDNTRDVNSYTYIHTSQSRTVEECGQESKHYCCNQIAI